LRPSTSMFGRLLLLCLNHPRLANCHLIAAVRNQADKLEPAQ
jgi:hypothetical protein